MGSGRLTERILHIRQMEEVESRRALDVALGELVRLELALRAIEQRERTGRSLVVASAKSGEIVDRIAGMEETRSAGRKLAALTVRVRATEDAVASLRQDYLGKRTSRLQAETLVETELAREARTNVRRGQQALDDWYLNRLRFKERGRNDGGRIERGRIDKDRR